MNEDGQIPVPVCELCWLIDHTSWEPESMDESGQVLMRMAGVIVPKKVNEDSVEICSNCGSITVSGIYEFKYPSDIQYLDIEDEDIGGEDDPTVFVISLNDKEDLED
jgi:hypothetical protein